MIYIDVGKPSKEEIKEQKRELKEVLSFLNEKNIDRVNDDIHEVYLKQKNPKNAEQKPLNKIA